MWFRLGRGWGVSMHPLVWLVLVIVRLWLLAVVAGGFLLFVGPFLLIRSIVRSRRGRQTEMPAQRVPAQTAASLRLVGGLVPMRPLVDAWLHELGPEGQRLWGRLSDEEQVHSFRRWWNDLSREEQLARAASVR
jgi:hypothetical protein